MNDLAALVRWAELGRYKAIGEWSSGSGESGSGLEPMPMNNSEWIFFGLLTFCDFFVLLLLISSLGGFFRRLSDHRTTRARRQAGQSSLSDALAVQSMAIIVPCYLPNEQYIMMETVEHIMTRLKYPSPFSLILCYNTPTPLPIEDELAQLDGRVYPGDRVLRILPVQGSRSKAENINAAMRDLVQSELVAIYDADHHPDPESLLIATAYMRAHKCDCVQGSTYLRVTNSLMACFINAEFFVTHFVYFPALQFLTTMGVFGGSNAVWKVSTLRAYEFRADVQTEDVELSTRVLLGRVRIRFCPEARSGELPPTGLGALFKQRLRWAIGWDQASIQHFSGIFSSKLSCCKKLGMIYLLPMRWLLILTAIFNACVAPALSLGYMLAGYTWDVPVEIVFQISFYSFVGLSLIVLCNAAIYEPPRNMLFVTLFQVAGILYLLWQLVLILISLVKICTGNAGGWVVTQRTGFRTAHFGVTMNVDSVLVASVDDDVKGLRNTVSSIDGISPLIASRAADYATLVSHGDGLVASATHVDSLAPSASCHVDERANHVGEASSSTT